MRFLKTSVLLVVSVLLLCDATLLRAAGPEQTVAGRLIFENGDFSCERCVVSLLVNSIRPIGSVFADLSGRFTFSNVPRGTYTLRVEIEGFEPVTQQVDAYDTPFEVNVMVNLVRKQSNPAGGAQVVNIAEFLDRYPKKAVSYFEKGSQSLKKQNTGEAVKYFREAVELAPTFYEAHNQLGLAYKAAGRFDDAENEFVKAHELSSTSVEPLLNLTNLYLEQNDPARAVVSGEQAIKANSRSASAFLGLGMALYRAAQLDRAEAVLRRALDLAPKMATVRLMLANVYLKLRRYDNTIEQLNMYIAENPRGDQLTEALRLRDQLTKATGSDERQ